MSAPFVNALLSFNLFQALLGRPKHESRKHKLTSIISNNYNDVAHFLKVAIHIQKNVILTKMGMASCLKAWAPTWDVIANAEVESRRVERGVSRWKEKCLNLPKLDV